MAIIASNARARILHQVSRNADYTNPYSTADQFPLYTYTPNMASDEIISLIIGTVTKSLSQYTSINLVEVQSDPNNTSAITVGWTDATTLVACTVSLAVGQPMLIPNVRPSSGVTLLSAAIGSAWVMVTGS